MNNAVFKVFAESKNHGTELFTKKNSDFKL